VPAFLHLQAGSSNMGNAPAKQASPRPLSPEELAASMTRLPDDCVGEVYRHCPDGETKRNLRTCCKAFCSSPAIKSHWKGPQGVDITLRTWPEDHPPPAIKQLPPYFPVRRLGLGYARAPKLLARAAQDSGRRDSLSSVEELKCGVSRPLKRGYSSQRRTPKQAIASFNLQFAILNLQF
jgi:hypothetical protein